MKRSKYKYRCVATSLEGLIQQVAVGYVARGYRFWVGGTVSARLTPDEHDHRLLEKFQVARSKWSRYRRRQRGIASGRELANVQYIRYGNFWLLLATRGEHRFFDEHATAVADASSPKYRDVRESPICYGGYSIAWNERVRVRMAPNAYRELKAHYISLAKKLHSEKALESEFWYAPFEPYGGVTHQMFAILREVNRVRTVAGLRRVRRQCIRVKRKSVRPFELCCVDIQRANEAQAELRLAA